MYGGNRPVQRCPRAHGDVGVRRTPCGQFAVQALVVVLAVVGVENLSAPVTAMEGRLGGGVGKRPRGREAQLL